MEPAILRRPFGILPFVIRSFALLVAIAHCGCAEGCLLSCLKADWGVDDETGEILKLCMFRAAGFGSFLFYRVWSSPGTLSN